MSIERSLEKMAMVRPRMPGWIKPALITTVGVGALGGAASLGYHAGMKKGVIRTADAMTDAFSQANQIENQQIADDYYEMGLEDALNKISTFKGDRMNKQATLETVYNEAFQDELSKIAAAFGTNMTTVAKGIKNLVASGETSKRGINKARKEGWEAVKKGAGKMWGENKGALAGIAGGTAAVGGAGYLAGSAGMRD